MRFHFLSSSIKVALLLSLSFTATSSSSFFFNPKSSFPLSLSSLSLPPSPSPKATVTDLLSLLGSKNQASKVNSHEARELRSCLKFLVPFNFTFDGISLNRRSMASSVVGQRREIQENELIWWPPSPVLELARLSVDSGGDPGAIHRALDPTIIPVPDVEGSKEDRCELTRTPYGRHFINKELNDYLVFLFEMIASRGPSVGLNVSLNRYDLFHGHLFLAKDTGRLGILFHAKEYPAYDKEFFPYNLGYCQTEMEDETMFCTPKKLGVDAPKAVTIKKANIIPRSDLAYDSTVNLRNILWLAPMPSSTSRDWVAPGVLVVLDARPDGIIYRDLIPEYVQIVRTLYEDDFGETAVDVNYLNVGVTSPNYQIFLC